jgi:hypothetical protein
MIVTFNFVDINLIALIVAVLNFDHCSFRSEDRIFPKELITYYRRFDA